MNRQVEQERYVAVWAELGLSVFLVLLLGLFSSVIVWHKTDLRQCNEIITIPCWYKIVFFKAIFQMFDFNLYTLYVQRFRVLNIDDSCDLKVDHFYS